jgi:ribosome maturation factor RimP
LFFEPGLLVGLASLFKPTLFCGTSSVCFRPAGRHFLAMTHPLIPAILELAAPVAAELRLEVVAAVFQTHHSPPVLRVDIRNPVEDTSLNDCEKMSRALELVLDASDLIPDAYELEISSPGLSRQLSSDRDFISFRGFEVIVRGQEGDQQNGTASLKEWSGNLVRRDPDYLYLNQKGRAIKIKRNLIQEVQLVENRAS